MIDFEEVDHSLILENKIKKSERKAWIHSFLTNTAPNFEQAKKFFSKKGIDLTEKEYRKACKDMFKTEE